MFVYMIPSEFICTLGKGILYWVSNVHTSQEKLKAICELLFRCHMLKGLQSETVLIEGSDNGEQSGNSS